MKIRTKSKILSLLLCSTLLMFSGCARPYKDTKQVELTEDKNIQLLKEQYEREKRDEIADGTIDISPSIDLLSDYNGDITIGKTIRIRVSESLKMKNKNQTDDGKTSSNSISGGGVTSANARMQGFLDKTINPVASIGVNTNVATNFNARANETRDESLNTYITGLITERISKNLFKIEAKKEIIINDTKKTMLLLGFVHSSNIVNENEISSDKILNLKIEYKSEGGSEDTLSKGFFQNLMNKIF